MEKAVSIAKDIRAKLGDNGDGKIATTVWPSVRIDSTSEFTSSGNIPGIGRDFAFSENSLKAELNKWSQPIKGTSNVYLINVSIGLFTINHNLSSRGRKLQNNFCSPKIQLF